MKNIEITYEQIERHVSRSKTYLEYVRTNNETDLLP